MAVSLLPSPLIKLWPLQESCASPPSRVLTSEMLLCSRSAIWLQTLRSADALQLLAVLRLICLPWQPFQRSTGDPEWELFLSFSLSSFIVSVCLQQVSEWNVMCSSHDASHKFRFGSGDFAPSHSIFSCPFNQQTSAAALPSGEGRGVFLRLK